MNAQSNQKTDYQKYLEELHGKLNTSDEIIFDSVKDATGKVPVSKERITAGEANEVYNVVLPNSQHVIVRISRKETPDFGQEKWAIDQCKILGIPAPEILLIKHINVHDQLLSICIQEKLEGDPLERGAIDYHTLDRNYLKKIIVDSGGILSKIHSVDTLGFGELNEKGEGKIESFYNLMSNKLEESDKYLKLSKEVDFGTDKMEKILKILSERLHDLPNITPKLIHGDYGPKHIMVKGDKITGILDWGDVCGNSPLFDFARWDYWFGEEVPTDWLIEGYQNKSLFTENFSDLLHWMRLDLGLEVLSWYAEQNYPKAIEKAKKKLLTDLEYFQ